MSDREIDLGRLYELMDDYRDAVGSRRRQREIENKVLEETVWQVRQEEYVLPEDDLRALLDRIDDSEARRFLRRILLNFAKSVRTL